MLDQTDISLRNTNCQCLRSMYNSISLISSPVLYSPPNNPSLFSHWPYPCNLPSTHVTASSAGSFNVRGQVTKAAAIPFIPQTCLLSLSAGPSGPQGLRTPQGLPSQAHPVPSARSVCCPATTTQRPELLFAAKTPPPLLAR